jgi:hypothetical protein
MRAHDEHLDAITTRLHDMMRLHGDEHEWASLRKLVEWTCINYVPQYEWSERHEEADFRATPIRYGGKVVTLEIRCGPRVLKYNGLVPAGTEGTSMEEQVRERIRHRAGDSLVKWILTGEADDDAG